MSIVQMIFTVIVFITSIFLIVVVLLQQGKSSGVAGAVGGGGDTFLSKNKSNNWNKKLAGITKIVAFVFMGCVLILNLL